MLWDFAAEPLALALQTLVAPGRCEVAALVASYGAAQPSAPLPETCRALAAQGATPAGQALCQDLVAGTCGHIPSPPPAGGHACDAAWTQHFGLAGNALAEAERRVRTPLESTLRHVDPERPPALRGIVEDHADPTPRARSPRARAATGPTGP